MNGGIPTVKKVLFGILLVLVGAAFIAYTPFQSATLAGLIFFGIGVLAGILGLLDTKNT